MSKFLLIGSIAAMLYGDCAWGMGDDIDPWKGTSSGAGQFSAESSQSNASPRVRSRRNSIAFSQDVQTQTEQSWNGQTQANPQQLQENRFIKIEIEHANDSSGAVLNNTYMQYHYDLSNNSKIGYATPTTVITITKDDLKNWNDISEIRYANDVSYDKLGNPKVILYRNKDNSCYIILRTDDGKKYGVFYGLDERNVEIGRNSFAVYDVSDDVGSFTDGVERLIYVDESGLYFVPVAGNSVEDVTDSYQKGGKFNFKGSVIKVSAIDGTITWNGNAITKDNFFDNWVVEESHAFQRTKNGFVGIPPSWNKIVLSTKQPKSNEILRNFYPPNGRYDGIYFQEVKNERGEYRSVSMNSYRGGISWLNSFVSKRLSLTKATNKNGAEELVRDGTFASILSLPKELFTPSSSMFGSDLGYYQKVYDAVEAQVVEAKKEQPQTGVSLGRSNNSAIPKSISGMVSQNPTLFKNPDFVRKLKPAFAELEKDYEHNKGSELWLPFEIVRNL
ncbi:MAG: hypothetical protein K5780_03100 [Alphaproteobacteria bacterium]|nr:hypothetical protein [Alphaproteobacteria bacterium]